MDTATESAAVAAARAGDEAAFASLAEKYRRELHVHCYRMLGSFQDAEDMVQETYLRAWHKRATFEGRSTFRAWLYSIATNACIDALESRERRPHPVDTTDTDANASEIPWLQPYPDRLLDAAATSDSQPDAAIVAKETIELAFLVAIQLLPPRQRAVLVMRDVLGWSAKETAVLLETSVASANSALQRGRATLKKHLPARRSEWAPTKDPSDEERTLLRRYIDASERGDADTFLDIMREDARFSMPPEPGLFVGAKTIVDGWRSGGFGSEEFGDFRCLLTSANRQPAVACYLRHPGESEFRSFAIDVLRIEGGLIAEIITFPLDDPAAYDLPSKL